jgi:hypothetical protein
MIKGCGIMKAYMMGWEGSISTVDLHSGITWSESQPRHLAILTKVFFCSFPQYL